MRGNLRTLNKPQSLCADCESCADCRHYTCLYSVDVSKLYYANHAELAAIEEHGYDSDEEAVSLLMIMRENEPCVIDEGDGLREYIWSDELRLYECYPVR